MVWSVFDAHGDLNVPAEYVSPADITLEIGSSGSGTPARILKKAVLF